MDVERKVRPVLRTECNHKGPTILPNNEILFELYWDSLYATPSCQRDQNHYTGGQYHEMTSPGEHKCPETRREFETYLKVLRALLRRPNNDKTSLIRCYKNTMAMEIKSLEIGGTGSAWGMGSPIKCF